MRPWNHGCRGLDSRTLAIGNNLGRQRNAATKQLTNALAM